MQRQQQLAAWLHALFPGETFTLSTASADASFRRYFRVTFAGEGDCDMLPAKPADCGNNRPAAAPAPAPVGAAAPCRGRTRIVMDAPPEHEDCRPFLHVAGLFEAAGAHVPHVYAQDLRQGFLLLSDLGSTTYLDALSGHGAVAVPGNEMPCPSPSSQPSSPGGGSKRPLREFHANGDTARDLYGAATDALVRIQLASRENELPPYDEALLRRELNLFPDWYVAKHLGVTLGEKQRAALETVFARILANNLAQPRVYVHRDYHSRNLMYIAPPLSNSLPMPSPQSSPASGKGGKRENQSLIPAGERTNEKGNLLTSPGILDFQDAVYGPVTYDLVSLFKDAYIRWEESETLDWLIRYWEKARKVGLPVHGDFSAFYRDYEWMGVQRHIKVLGIFARLCHRDGKDGYLKDMPLVMDYLRRACERYIDLKPLLNLLDELEPREVRAGYTF